MAVAGFANSTTAIINDLHGNVVSHIRRVLGTFYRTWGYKASFLEPFDRRAREWNKGADHLAGYCLTVREDRGALFAECIRHAARSSKALQFFSDGGFVEGVGGAAGVQLLAYSLEEGCLKRYVIGYRYLLGERYIIISDGTAGIRNRVEYSAFCNLIEGACTENI